MPAPVERTQRRLPAAGPSMMAGDPEPGFFEWNTDAAKASARLAERDLAGYMARRREAEQTAAVQALIEATGDKQSQYLRPMLSAPGMSSSIGSSMMFDGDAFWRRVAELRAADPKALPGLAQNEDAFEADLAARVKRETARYEQRADKGGMISRLAGGVLTSAIDPVNIVTVPFGGGGRTILTQILRAGLANAAVETVAQPLIAGERAQQGRTLTGEEAALNIGAAFVFGSTLDAAGRGAKYGLPAANEGLRKATDAVVQKSWDKLPQGLRDRYAARQLEKLDPLDDEVLLADLSEAIIGPDRMSDRERAALAVVRREAALDQGGPLARDGAGQALHRDLLAQAMARIETQFPPETRVPRPAPNRADLMGGSALDGRGARGITGGSAIDAYMARNRRAESGGNDLAQAGTSSAFGRYQFTRGTWLRYYTRRFGTGGLTEAQILAKRADGRLQDVLMRDLTEDNAAMLRGIGAPVTEGNLYLAHFLGPGDARKVLMAAADEPIEGLVRADSVAANRKVFDKVRTAADLLRWADGKMGGRGQAIGAGSGAQLDPVLDADAARSAQLRTELDAINAENARLSAELAGDAGRGMDELVDDGLELTPAERSDLPEVPEVALPPLEPRAADPDAPPAEVLAILPDLRTRAQGQRGLVRTEQLATELGVDEDTLVQALQSLVAEGTITTRRRDGAFLYKPPRIPRGEESLLEFIASRGGLDDTGGDLTSIGADRWHLRDKPVKTTLKSRTGKVYEKLLTTIPGRGKLVRRSSAQIAADKAQGGMLGRTGYNENSIEAMFDAAISAGYFPEFQAQRELGDDFADKIDVREFVAAIEAELRGQKRYRQGTRQFDEMLNDGEARRYWDSEAYAELAPERTGPIMGADRFPDATPDELDELDWAVRAYERTLADVDPEIVSGALYRYRSNRQLFMSQAFDLALDDFAARNAGDAFAQTGNPRYEEVDYGEEIPEFGSEGPGAAAGSPFPGDRAAAGDRGGPGGGQPDSAAGAARGRAAGETGRAASEGPPLADLPREQAAPFLDPDGPEIQAQLDSLDHDARARLNMGAAVDGEMPVLRADMPAEAMYQAIKSLPDTEASQNALAVMRASIWDEAKAAGTLSELGGPIDRFDAARERWDDQFSDARAARSQAEAAAQKEADAVLASEIIKRVDAGGEFGLPNPVRGNVRIYKAGAVRMVDGVLQVPEGSKWVNIPQQYLRPIAAALGIKPDVAPLGPLDLGAAVDPAVAERQRQAAQLGAQGPMRARTEQDGTIGLGLFDAADQPEFRLDMDGEEKPLRSLLDELDAEAQAIKNSKDCL